MSSSVLNEPAFATGVSFTSVTVNINCSESDPEESMAVTVIVDCPFALSEKLKLKVTVLSFCTVGPVICTQS